jgi:hypothetical protein
MKKIKAPSRHYFFAKNHVVPGPSCITGYAFKHPSKENGAPDSDVVLDDDMEEQISDDDNFIRCVQCLHAITRPEERMVIDGSYQHTFANPHGILFEIACFRSAEGCRYLGPATDEFTWFKGYAWRISVCGKCLLHLGWQYISAGKDSFYGLINDRLIYRQ